MWIVDKAAPGTCRAGNPICPPAGGHPDQDAVGRADAAARAPPCPRSCPSIRSGAALGRPGRFGGAPEPAGAVGAAAAVVAAPASGYRKAMRVATFNILHGRTVGDEVHPQRL
ncbi:MAG: hypothetical protein PHQ28_14750, partial [Mycobacterium sp.]|nr:hypothetical protein [Mycobacterium sp.]